MLSADHPYVALVSRTCGTLEWVLMDVIECVAGIPIHFVKWDGNVENIKAWLPGPWKSLILIGGSLARRSVEASPGAGSTDNIRSLLQQLVHQEASGRRRPVFLVGDAPLLRGTGDVLPRERVVAYRKLNSSLLCDLESMVAFADQVCHSLGTQAPRELIEATINASKTDLDTTCAQVDTFTQTRGSRPERLSRTNMNPAAERARNFVPLLCQSDKDVRIRGAAYDELVCTSDVLHWNGFKLSQVQKLKSARDGLDLKGDFAVVHATKSTQMAPWFEPVLRRCFAPHTRRYFIHDLRSLTPAVADAVKPVVNWAVSDTPEPPIFMESDPGDLLDYGRLYHASLLGASAPSTQEDLQVRPPHLMLRDIRSERGERRPWRRVDRYRDRPPEALIMETEYFVLTALEKERDKVLRSSLVAHEISVDSSSHDLRLIYVRSQEGGLLPVLLGCVTEAGRVPAALFSDRTLRKWKPKFLLMCGIAGSLAANASDEPHIGDVVVATGTIDYEYAKIKNAYNDREHGELAKALSHVRARYAECTLADYVKKFMQAVNWRMPEDLMLVAEELWRSATEVQLREEARKLPQEWLSNEGIEASLNKKLDARSPLGQVHFGVSCTGDKVVASEQFKFELMKALSSLNFNIRSVEMEGSGVQRAVRGMDNLKFAMIRGISDDATSAKSDRWQEVAAQVAAEFTLSFIQWHAFGGMSRLS